MNHMNEIIATARSNTYQFLALAFGYPDANPLSKLQRLSKHLEACLKAQEDQDCQAQIEAIRPIVAKLTVDEWRDLHLRCFGHTTSKECPPYETEYGQTHIFRKSSNLADIVGFYRAFGMELAPDLNDRWDHISVELEFMQLLTIKEAYALEQGHTKDKEKLCRDTQIEFIDKHLGCWALGFARRLYEKTSGRGFYGKFAKFLEVFLLGEMRLLGVEPATEMPPLLEDQFEDEDMNCGDCNLANSAMSLNEEDCHEPT